MDRYTEEVMKHVQILETSGRYAQLKNFPHHGTTSVYAHSIAVALTALKLKDAMHLDVDRTALIRGALLHDYFLYDWHHTPKEYGLHGFTHPFTALRNALEDYDLSPVEQDIIRTHMFPLVPLAPKYPESWLVTAADKLAAGRETAAPYLLRIRRTG